jgi:hypothetical protein
MASITIEDVTITVWNFGVEIVHSYSTNKTFVAKSAIACLSTVNELNYCSIRYIPIHSHAQSPVELVTWHKEKANPIYANNAYNFIVNNLYA